LIGLFTKSAKGSWFGVSCDEKYVFGTSFGRSEEDVIRDLLHYLPFDVPFEVFQKPSPLAEQALISVQNAYQGKEASLGIPLATERLSQYFRNVLEVTSLIPVGYVSSYGSVAKAAGGSARSVGGVMAANSFAPIVPCHRVVRSDFSLGGYGGGLRLKAEMLRREKRGYTSAREIPIDGKKLKVFPVEFVLNKTR
jgi:O-6-methylguanine DNA methyltransferase